MSILDDINRIIAGLPKSPFDGRVVIIPAERFEYERIEVDTDENGKQIEVVKKIINLMPRSEFRWIFDECRRNNVDYQLSEFVPAVDDKGKPCVYTIPKPKSPFSILDDF